MIFIRALLYNRLWVRVTESKSVCLVLLEDAYFWAHTWTETSLEKVSLVIQTKFLEILFLRQLSLDINRSQLWEIRFIYALLRKFLILLIFDGSKALHLIRAFSGRLPSSLPELRRVSSIKTFRINLMILQIYLYLHFLSNLFLGLENLLCSLLSECLIVLCRRMTSILESFV